MSILCTSRPFFDEKILRSAHFLNTVPLNETWTHSSLASQVGLSSAHLNRLFVAAFRMTPKNYFSSRRKLVALQLIREGRLPFKQVAHDLGFSSASYFSSWFREQFGEPPGSWRLGEGGKEY